MNQNSQKKTQSKQSTTTIDEKHTELLNLFHENETETIPRLLKEKERLKTQYNSYRKAFRNEQER